MTQPKNKLSPKLRFPEFRGTGEWKSIPLGQLLLRSPEYGMNAPAVPYSEHLPTYLRITDIDNDGRFISEGKSSVAAEVIEENYLNDGDIVLARTGASVGKSYRYREQDGRFVFAGFLIRVCPNTKKLNSIFLANYITTTHYWDWVHVTSARSGQPGINGSEYATFPIPIPSSDTDEYGLAEQQKIADCLASLDEVIAAQWRKVETLKTHKRGLMQRLFPRDGESVPRLRFPEFRDGPEWTMRELGPLASKVGSGVTPRGGDKNYKTEGRPFVRSQNVGWGELILNDIAFIDEETHKSFDSTEIKASDVLLNITGASIGRSAIADSRVAGGNVNQHVCIIRVKRQELNPVLLNQFLISERGQKQIDSFQAGGNRQGLNFAQIRSFEIPLPPTEDEQRGIADCLSSLDARIVGEAEKLDVLKERKRGLMQRLFPVAEGEL